MVRLAAFVALSFVSLGSVATGRVPDIEDLIGITSIGEARISPDGDWVAYTVTAADLDEDAYVSQVWLVDTVGNRTQLTRAAKASTRPRWSPDGKWLTFLSARHEDKTQVFAIRRDGGEAVRLTDAKASVSSYAFSPDGAHIAYVATQGQSDYAKSRDEHMGGFTVVRGEYLHQHLWTVDVAEAFETPTAGKQRTRGEDLSVGDIAWSPGQRPGCVQRGSRSGSHQPPYDRPLCDRARLGLGYQDRVGGRARLITDVVTGRGPTSCFRPPWAGNRFMH